MVKSIIKRVIVGVGIALVLMTLKDGGLIATAYAMSCDTNNSTIFHGLNSSINGFIPNSNPTAVYYHRVATRSNTLIPFRDSDYIEILVPMSYILTFQYEEGTNPATGNSLPEDIETLQQPLVYIEENTNNPNTNSWNQGYSDGSFYHFKFFKSNYPNKDNLSITYFRIGVPNFNLNKVNVQLWVEVNDYWQYRLGYCDSNQALQNAIDENTQAVEDVNNSITDNTTDDPSSDISTMNGKLASNNSITQLLTLPIQMYQNILNAVSGSCSSFSLGSLYNHNLTLPCINLENLLGSTLYGIIDILISGLFILSFRKKMVDIFNHMTSLNDRGNEVE